MVIDKGQIVEWGTHEELLAQHDRYFDLYLTQFAERPSGNGTNGAVSDKERLAIAA